MVSAGDWTIADAQATKRREKEMQLDKKRNVAMQYGGAKVCGYSSLCNMAADSLRVCDVMVVVAGMV